MELAKLLPECRSSFEEALESCNVQYAPRKTSLTYAWNSIHVRSRLVRAIQNIRDTFLPHVSFGDTSDYLHPRFNQKITRKSHVISVNLAQPVSVFNKNGVHSQNCHNLPTMNFPSLRYKLYMIFISA